jgi:hypothetical protein
MTPPETKLIRAQCPIRRAYASADRQFGATSKELVFPSLGRYRPRCLAGFDGCLEGSMIAAVVTFEFDSLDDERVRKVAAEARAMFEGMPSLRNKFFTLDKKNRRALNFYVWESEEAARQFFSDELIDRVTSLYGVRPQLDFVEVLELVDNS